MLSVTFDASLSFDNHVTTKRAIANALQLKVARATLAPFRLSLRRHAKFEVAEPYYSVFAADILLCVVTLTFNL